MIQHRTLRSTANGLVTHSTDPDVMLDQADRFLGEKITVNLRMKSAYGRREVTVTDFEIIEYYSDVVHMDDHMMSFIVTYRGKTYRVSPRDVRIPVAA